VVTIGALLDLPVSDAALRSWLNHFQLATGLAGVQRGRPATASQDALPAQPRSHSDPYATFSSIILSGKWWRVNSVLASNTLF